MGKKNNGQGAASGISGQKGVLGGWMEKQISPLRIAAVEMTR
jgi:hypothetical protein